MGDWKYTSRCGKFSGTANLATKKFTKWLRFGASTHSTLLLVKWERYSSVAGSNHLSTFGHIRRWLFARPHGTLV